MKTLNPKNLIQKIETHTYAPELNKVHLRNGVTLSLPSVTSFAEARKRLFKPANTRRVAIIEVSHPDVDINRVIKKTHSGIINDYAEVKQFMVKLREWHNIEGTEFKIKTKLLG